jgi:hypothetical protein
VVLFQNFPEEKNHKSIRIVVVLGQVWTAHLLNTTWANLLGHYCSSYERQVYLLVCFPVSTAKLI